MSTKQSSSIRVKTSTAPWAKKKQNHPKNTKKQNDSNQWPDLNKNSKATQTIPSPTKYDNNNPPPNQNNTASSTKYKSNPINPTQLNTNHSNTNTVKIQSPPRPPPTNENISNNAPPPHKPTADSPLPQKKQQATQSSISHSKTTITAQPPHGRPPAPHTHTQYAHSSDNGYYNNFQRRNPRGHGRGNYRGRGRGRGRGRVRGRGRGRGRGRDRGRGRGRGGRDRGRGYYHDDRYNNRRNNNLNSAPRHNRQRQNQNRNHNDPEPDAFTSPPVNVNVNVPLVPIHVYPIPAIEESKLERPVVITTVNNAYNIYNGITYYNPYLNLNANMNNLSLLAMEPNVDSIHLTINEYCGEVPAWNGEISIPSGPYFVLKVSCVATGSTVDDRSVGHIALVDWNLKTKANIFVKPQQEIVSYITPLTSLNEELLNKYGYSLQDAIKIIKSELPKNAVLIGQNITMDLQWLGLRGNGVDFKNFIDLRDVWRSWSQYYKSYTHYSINHQAKCVLNRYCDGGNHSASADAIMTMKLFQYYMYCRYFNMQLFHNKIQRLQETIIEPSFSKKHPIYEGVQMQAKKYKGVPYITAKPKIINLDMNAADLDKTE